MDKNEIMEARKGVEWRRLQPYEKENAVVNAMNTARMLKDMGEMNASQKAFVTTELIPFMDRHCPSLTDEEVELALKYGVRMELGNRDSYVNAANAEQWLKAYAQSTMRADCIEGVRQGSRTPSQNDIDKLNGKAMEDGVHEAYAWYRQSGGYILNDTHTDGGIRLPHLASLIYQWHRSMGHIPQPTQDDIRQADEYAQYMLEQKYTTKIKGLDIQAVKDDFKDTALLALYFQKMSGVIFTY